MDFTDAADDTVAETGEVTADEPARPPAPHEATPDDIERYNEEWLTFHPHAGIDRSSANNDPTVQLPTVKALDTEGSTFRSQFPWLHDPSRGVRWDFDPIELRVLAQNNAWVEMLVQTVGKELAETSWTIVETDSRAETQKRLHTHPDDRAPLQKAPALGGNSPELPENPLVQDIYDLLMQPTPDHDWFDLVEMWSADLLEVGSLTGVKAFDQRFYNGENQLVAHPAGITPQAIVPSAPEVWTKDYRDKSGLIDGYIQFDRHSTPGAAGAASRGVAQAIPFDKDEVVWSDHAPRTNRAYGIPPTLLVKSELQSLDLAVTQEQQYLSRGSIPSGAWVFEEWSREAIKEWKAENQENIKGKPHKSLMFAGQGGDVRFEPMSMNFKELEFTERMRWYARVVASAFQVPTAVVGLEPEQVNYATFQGERENFEANTLGPYLQQFERVINNQIIRPHWGDGYRFEFVPGMSESTRQMITNRVTTEFAADLSTRNEARRELGRAPVDEEADGFKSEVVTTPDAEDAADALTGLMQESMSKGDPTRENHDVDPGEGVGYCENSGKEFECETMRDLAGDCPHCGDPISYIDEEDLDKDFSKAEADSDDNAALRNTEDARMFDVQPAQIEALHDEIAPDVEALWDTILSDDEVERIIEELAAEPDETAKSLTGLTRRLKDILAGNEVADKIKEAVQDARASEARAAIERAARQEDAEIDPDPIMQQVLNRDLSFADRLVDRVESQVREVVAEGWQDGKNAIDIRDDIAAAAGSDADWGTEKIARQELQIAAGQARNEFAAEIGKVEVWIVSGGTPDEGATEGDGRVREAHQAMNGKWKRPEESWRVDYSAEGRGVETEKVPGESEPGIGCRCFTVLRDREQVDSDDHAGR